MAHTPEGIVSEQPSSEAIRALREELANAALGNNPNYLTDLILGLRASLESATRAQEQAEQQMRRSAIQWGAPEYERANVAEAALAVSHHPWYVSRGTCLDLVAKMV